MSEAIELVGSEGNVLRGDLRGEGAAPPVLFLHGGGQTRHAWAATAGRISSSRATITLDARGHGGSDWPGSGDYRFTAMAADLRAVVGEIAKRFGAAPVVVGASMGGLSAMLAAEDMPDAFAGLVLVDITPRMEQSGVDRILGFMGERAADGFASPTEAADAIAAYLPERKRPRSLNGLTKNLVERGDGRWYWHWDPRFVSGPLSVESVATGFEERLEAALARLRCPILLVRGSRSDLVSEDAVAAFRRAVPEAGYVDISGAGHMVVGDRNDAFGDAVETFLDRL